MILWVWFESVLNGKKDDRQLWYWCFVVFIYSVALCFLQNIFTMFSGKPMSAVSVSITGNSREINAIYYSLVWFESILHLTPCKFLTNDLSFCKTSSFSTCNGILQFPLSNLCFSVMDRSSIQSISAKKT